MVTLNTEAALVTADKDVDERGFGVVEIVISMFLLLIIAVAFLPLMIQGYRLSVMNSTVATATQLANQQVERVRGVSATALGTVGPTCASVVAALKSPAAATESTPGVLNADYKSNRGSVLSASGTLVWDAAPGGARVISSATDCTMGPSTRALLRLTSVVTDSASPAKPLAEVVTQIFVKGSV